MTKDEALKMAIKEMTDAIPHLDIHFDDYFEAINACKEALKPNPDCDEACMFQCQMEKEHGMTYEQGFDHGWEARLAEEQPAQIYPNGDSPEWNLSKLKTAQEPVAWMLIGIEDQKPKLLTLQIIDNVEGTWTPLYTHPHQCRCKE